MESSPLKCGIIGTGTFAAVHAEAIADSPSLRLIASLDRDAERSRAFAERWGAEAYEDREEFLKGNLDIVTVTTPNETHAAIVRDILNSARTPRLIVVEKPLCTEPEELHELAALLKGKEDRLVVDLTRRFNAGFERLRKLIESGELGREVRSVHFRYYAGWLHTGAHVVDTLRMLLGELRCIAASLKTLDRFPDDPLLDVELQSAKYPKASIHLEGIPEHPYAQFEAEIFLERGRIRIQWDDVFIDRLGDHGTRSPLLTYDEHFRVDPVKDALKNLYASGEALLRHSDKRILDIAGLQTARSTMEILFEARSKAGL